MQTSQRLRVFIPFVLLSSLIFVGCAAIRSSRHSGTETKAGLAYYLPAGRIKLIVVREVISPPKVQIANPGRVEKTTNLTTTTSGFQPNPGPLRRNPDGTINLDDAANRTLTNIITETRVIITDSAAAAAEKARRKEARQKKPRVNVLVDVAVELAADREQRYLLEMKQSSFADDFMKLRVTNGLLESVILTNSDQSLTALNNLALAAIEFAKVAAQAAAAGADGETITRTTNTFIFNPFDRGARDAVSRQLRALNVDMDLSDFVNVPIPAADQKRTDGVFYRPLQSYQLSWNTPSGMGAASVLLPNASPVLTLNVSRAAFVSQSWTLGMSQGIPYEVTLNKPSEVAAVSQFPLNVARALVSLPTNLVQLKFDIVNKNNELVKAQNAYITNLQNLIQEQRNFERWLATNAAVQRGPMAQPRGGQ